ncbi:TPA: hypothetical protein ACHJID_004612, partial [Escherichia coli]
MKKSIYHDIITQIEQDFNDPVRSVCRDLFLFLVSKDAKNINHFTYKTLINGLTYLTDTKDD